MPNLTHAMAYARKGWRVLPLWWPATPERINHDTGEVYNQAVCACPNPDCQSTGKHPLTRHGAHDGTTDPKQIEAWWGRWPQANIGIATGGESGIWVLDIDVDRGGGKSFKRAYLTPGRAKPAPTVTAITGGGGRHIIWKTWGEPVPCAVNLFPGVDTRGEGGLIVAPPSVHASGERYQWHREGRPGAVPVQPTPGWMRAIVNLRRNGGPQKRRTFDPNRPPRTVDVGKIQDMHEGGRNSGLFAVVCRMIRYGDKDILAKAHAINQTHCSPPLPDREVDYMVEQAVRRYPR